MKKKHSCSGSFTVEAALIMPIIIIIIIINLMYMTFCLHDQGVLQAALDETLQQYNLLLIEPMTVEGKIQYEDIYKKSLLLPYTMNADEVETVLYGRIKDKLQRKLLICDVGSLSINKELMGIQGSLSAKPRMFLSPVYQYIPYTDGITVTASVTVHTPADFARVSDNVLNVVLDIKGVDKIQEKIQELLNTLK